MRAVALFVALLIPALAVAQGRGGPAGLAEHDFGTVRQGQQVVHAFDIANTLDRELLLTGAEARAAGLRVRFPPSIPPGRSGKVTVEWDTSGVRGRVRGEVLIALRGAPEPQLRLVLAGVVQPLLEFRPMAAAYFSVWAGDAAEQTITIVSNDERPLNITRMELKGAHFQAKLLIAEEGRVHELRITVPAGTEPGRFMESVTLVTDHPRYPEFRVPVNVLVKADVYVNPETVQFGRPSLATLQPGTMEFLTQTFMLKKRQGRLRIRSVESDVASLIITRDPPDSESDAFRFDVALSKERLARGPLNGTIRIFTDDPDFPVLTIPVTGEVE